MSSNYKNDPMQEMFIFETTQQLEQLENLVIDAEAQDEYCTDSINEIFRIMHTIKGSAAMMMFNNISKVAHLTEDLFYYIREDKPDHIDNSSLCDIVLNGVDFIKLELEKIKNGDLSDGEATELLGKIKEHLEILKGDASLSGPEERELPPIKKQFYVSSNQQDRSENNNFYKAIIRFKDGCEMENIRAFTIIHNLKDITEEFKYQPEDIINDPNSCEIIKSEGFTIYIKTDKTLEFMENFFMETVFLDHIDLEELEDHDQYELINSEDQEQKQDDILSCGGIDLEKDSHPTVSHQGQSIISVSVEKLDQLMDLVGEMVISEAMVTQNPDLAGLSLENFEKSAIQLKKITSEVQDIVMAIRMVPLGPTFFKMNRVIRDMSKKLKKEIHLDIIGEETEVDKNIIERIGDPLMHLVRNAADHGIEDQDKRKAKNKPPVGTITLEAKNAGSEVLIIIKDDGKGLNKESILKKAIKNNVLTKAPEEMTDQEIYNLILVPGFSMNELVTEFSGRGVGMDVVSNNIEAVGGSIMVDSQEEIGTTITLKIPLTLAIIDGMNIKVGKTRYTIPITSIQESFRPSQNEVFKDTDENEMMMIRGECYKVLRLHDIYGIETDVKELEEGILVMVQGEHTAACLFADELLGQQQVVVKSLPQYIKNTKKIKGISGCTLLGDSNISLILDIEGLVG